jgi:uncharacterized membrane protein YoaT (DUF817 family)
MYACVGSYMVRAIRLFDMRFEPYPPFWMTAALALGIYLNFFAHHYISDFRYGLMAGTLLLFARTRIWFTPGGKTTRKRRATSAARAGAGRTGAGGRARRPLSARSWRR